jgi:hypothetical protein
MDALHETKEKFHFLRLHGVFFHWEKMPLFIISSSSASKNVLEESQAVTQ